MGYFGIDFGTTNTSAVEMDGRAVHRFGDAQGKPLPSVIILNQATDEVVGGRDAWNRRLELQQLGGLRSSAPSSGVWKATGTG